VREFRSVSSFPIIAEEDKTKIISDEMKRKQFAINSNKGQKAPLLIF
jgi:hypothetical protein